MDNKEKLPTFSKLIAILAVPASLFRIFIGVTLVQALLEGANSGMPVAYSWGEAVTGLLAGLFGNFGCANLLKRKPSSIKLCWLSIGFNAANIIIVLIGFRLMPMDLPWFDTVGMGLIRIAFTLAFAFAVIQAARWFRSQSAQTQAG
ncbi:MAG: hypothetical protein P1U86_22575 [Verrucomicrobiales bacterium]|nr:hypothetical protein [Verrucomicrobiales bacterium]